MYVMTCLDLSWGITSVQSHLLPLPLLIFTLDIFIFFFFLWAVFISVVHWKKQTKQFTHADNFRGGVQVCGPPVENELSSPVFVCTPARSFVFHSAVGGLFGCLPQTGVSLDVVYVTQFLHWGDPKKCTHFVTFIQYMCLFVCVSVCLEPSSQQDICWSP